MLRNRVRTSGWLVAVLLLASAAGCGGDPASKGDPTSAGSSTPATSGSTFPEPSESTFPPDVLLADGPWIPSPSFKIKVPKGFKGESDFGVITLSKGDFHITVYDPNGLGDSSLRSAIKTEKQLNFTGKTDGQTGSATVDGQDVQTFVLSGKYEFFRRVAYGFGVDDSDGQTRFVVLGFESERDPTAHQDTIDAVLSSLTWSPKVVGQG